MNVDKEKSRLDLLLVERGIFLTRNRARAEIMAGNVFVDGKKSDKPGQSILCHAEVEVRKDSNPYVSRGGLKLKKALEEFKVDLNNKIALDMGASTGGFTHCMLEHGAAMVYAVDVGYGQLAWELRNDSRVINMERVNARYLKREDLHRLPDFATIDVSFISLEKILPTAAALDVSEIICLIKPQFEASPAKVGKKGVVRDRAVHEEVIIKVVNCASNLSYRVGGITFSPIKGPQGNIEYLLYLVKNSLDGDQGDSGVKDPDDLILSVISYAHSLL
ncbi:MAG: TlyA family RNA methyltransferase [Bacillota bacterium]|nr:TlyA family RNA methyltransferase [Bacillota bacterium]